MLSTQPRCFSFLMHVEGCLDIVERSTLTLKQKKKLWKLIGKKALWKMNIGWNFLYGIICIQHSWIYWYYNQDWINQNVSAVIFTSGIAVFISLYFAWFCCLMISAAISVQTTSTTLVFAFLGTICWVLVDLGFVCLFDVFHAA